MNDIDQVVESIARNVLRRCIDAGACDPPLDEVVLDFDMIHTVYITVAILILGPEEPPDWISATKFTEQVITRGIDDYFDPNYQITISKGD